MNQPRELLDAWFDYDMAATPHSAVILYGHKALGGILDMQDFCDVYPQNQDPDGEIGA